MASGTIARRELELFSPITAAQRSRQYIYSSKMRVCISYYIKMVIYVKSDEK